MRKQQLSGLILAAVLLLVLLTSFRQQRLAQKSFVRAVLVQKTSAGYAVGLMFQDVAASADASKAGEQLALCTGQGESLAAAFINAETHLPEQSDYKLCEYTVVCPNTEFTALREYQQFLMQNSTQGRLSSCVYACDQPLDILSDAAEKEENFVPEWLELLGRNRQRCQRLYDAMGKGVLALPLIRVEDDMPVSQCERSILTDSEGLRLILDESSAQIVTLLQQKSDQARFLLRETPLVLRGIAADYSLVGQGRVQIRIQAKVDTDTPAAAAQLQVIGNELLDVVGSPLIRLLQLDAVARMAGITVPVTQAELCLVLQ